MRTPFSFLVALLTFALAPAGVERPLPVRAQVEKGAWHLFSEMRWRWIGPLRGGRTKAVVGVPSQPSVFYIGVCNGGVWKTTDYGRTWTEPLTACVHGSGLVLDPGLGLSNDGLARSQMVACKWR